MTSNEFKNTALGIIFQLMRTETSEEQRAALTDALMCSIMTLNDYVLVRKDGIKKELEKHFTTTYRDSQCSPELNTVELGTFLPALQRTIQVQKDVYAEMSHKLIEILKQQLLNEVAHEVCDSFESL